MNKSAIQKFAIWARTTLMEQVAQRAYQYGITKDGYGEENAITVNGMALSSQEQSQRLELVREIQAKGYDQVVEEVAYTWFNRFIALRYMEVNNYLPSHIRVFSNAQGAFDPEILKEAYSTGLTAVFFPEFDRMMDTAQRNPHHCYSVGEHTLHAVRTIEPNPVLRLTMLLHDVGKPATKTTDEYGIDHFYNHYKVGADMSKEILKRLKFDNKTIQIVCQLISHHDIRFKDPKTNGRRHVRKVMHSIGPTLFPYLLKVMEADVRSQSDYYQAEKLAILKETWEAYEEILKDQDCLSLKDLKINGNQLKALGIREGKVIGAILNTLLSMVLEHPELNEYSYLKELALKIYRQLR